MTLDNDRDELLEHVLIFFFDKTAFDAHASIGKVFAYVVLDLSGPDSLLALFVKKGDASSAGLGTVRADESLPASRRIQALMVPALLVRLALAVGGLGSSARNLDAWRHAARAMAMVVKVVLFVVFVLVYVAECGSDAATVEMMKVIA